MRNEVLAFAEARQGGSGDTGDIDLVARRSADNGRVGARRWWDDGANTCGNYPVVTEDGAISTRNPGHDYESEIIAGTSEDAHDLGAAERGPGATWSAPARSPST